MDASHESAAEPVRPETLERIKAVIYDPRRCTSAATAFNAAARFLGRRSLSAEDLPNLDEASASRLAAALEKAYPDKGQASRQAIEDHYGRS